jgi:hypothetical protein
MAGDGQPLPHPRIVEAAHARELDTPMSSPAPVTLIFASFDDERNRFDYYWPRLRRLDVPTPETIFVDLEREGGRYRWDTERIRRFAADHGGRAFVRTQFKAATIRLREGSFIHDAVPDVIDGTIESLLNQNAQQGWPHGDGLVVREWLDLDFCRFPTHTCHPSVRYFVDDGEVIGRTPAPESEPTFVCGGGYDYLRPRLEELDFETPRRYAEAVAAAFPEATWGVDFDMTTAGEWYCTEFNLNGVYWNWWDRAWWNTCGQGEFEPFGPVEIHSAALWGVRPEADSRPRGRWW